MRTPFKALLGVLFGLFLFSMISLMGGDHAKAQTCCTAPSRPCSSCTTPTTPCNCTPPTPPTNCNCSPSVNINVPNVNVWVNAAVIVNANVAAQATAQAAATGQWEAGPGDRGPETATDSGRESDSALAAAGLGQALRRAWCPCCRISPSRPRAKSKRRVAYQASRTRTVKIIIQAFCLDDRGEPHPASQVFPEKDVDNDYEGELYRCIAGTRMQYVMADFNEKVSFDGGKTITCDKDQALYHTKDAKLECRKQAGARDCNERSLLRRFGAGIKILTIITTETYTAYREEEVEASSVSSSSSSSSSSSTSALQGVVDQLAY